MLTPHRESNIALPNVAPRGTVALLALLATLTVGNSDAVATDQPFLHSTLRPLCALWDGQASAAIVRTATENRPDLDVQRLGDDLARMQRARRSCDIGLIQAACQDYIAVMRGVGGTTLTWPGSRVVCPAALSHDPGLDVRQADARGD